MLILIITIVFSYFLMHAIEIASFATRVAGRVSSRVALGTTLQQTIYTTSRFLLIPMLPALGYLVESGILIKDYSLMILAAFAMSFLASVVILLNLNKFQHFFQVVFIKYSSNTIPIAVLKSFFYNKNDFKKKDCQKFSINKIIFKKTFVSFIAYLFLITGFFIAFMLAIIYPDNRLTLSQFTATFHGLGAVIFAFYLDPMLSRSIDNSQDEKSWITNIYSIMVGRALSYLAMIILMLFFILFF
jgi:hypothetical protein